MAQLIYQINSGYPNFTAHIEPNEADDQIHSSTGIYSFDVPEGEYSITVTDAIGCEAFFDNINVVATTTTTTTIFVPLCVEYGLLYNGYAANSEKNIANTNAHLPSREEFQTLVDNLGGNAVAGGKLKEIGTTHWTSTSIDVTNESGFTARGGAQRNRFGVFQPLKNFALYWTSTPFYFPAFPTLDGYNVVQIEHSSIGVNIGAFTKNYFTSGQSIRLVIDTPTEVSGSDGVYMGNDGKKYSCVLIGTQWWLASDLIETEFQDHTPITYIESDIDWENTVDEGYCAYVNEYSNVGCDFSIPTTTTTTTL